MACRIFGAKPLSEKSLAFGKINKTFQWNFNQTRTVFIQDDEFENVICKMATILSRPQYINWPDRGLRWCKYSPVVTHALEGKILPPYVAITATFVEDITIKSFRMAIIARSSIADEGTSLECIKVHVFERHVRSKCEAIHKYMTYRFENSSILVLALKR